MENNTIVVAVDGSEHSEKAALAAAGLADATGRELKLLHVHSYAGFTPIALGTIDQVELDRLKDENARVVFDGTLKRLGERAQAPEQVLLTGDPAKKIIDYMKANPGTHLFIGKRGLSKIQHLLLGSVSDKVVRHAPGMVTVVGN